MSICRVSNPRKLRKLSARLGQPVLCAFARWFDVQTTLLVFTARDVAWVVPKHGNVERYIDSVELFGDGPLYGVKQR